MKSRIYLSEKVKNKEFRLGQVQEYFPVEIVTGGRRQVALFTHSQIGVALERYKANQEDVAPPTRWQRAASSFRRWLFG